MPAHNATLEKQRSDLLKLLRKRADAEGQIECTPTQVEWLRKAMRLPADASSYHHEPLREALSALTTLKNLGLVSVSGKTPNQVLTIDMVTTLAEARANAAFLRSNPTETEPKTLEEAILLIRKLRLANKSKTRDLEAALSRLDQIHQLSK